MNEERNSRVSEVFVARRRKGGLHGQSHSCGALPSYSTRIRVRTGPNLLGATPAHEKPFNSEWNQLTFSFHCEAASPLWAAPSAGHHLPATWRGHLTASTGGCFHRLAVPLCCEVMAFLPYCFHHHTLGKVTINFLQHAGAAPGLVAYQIPKVCMGMRVGGRRKS